MEGPAVGGVPSLFHGLAFSVGIHWIVVGKVGADVDVGIVGTTIVILLSVLGTFFQGLLVINVQLGSSCVGRSVGEGDGRVGDIRLVACVDGAANWKGGGRIAGSD